MIHEVVYGAPERSVSEGELLAALAGVARGFDERPDRMLCLLGPPGLGVRWFTFACTNIRDRVMADVTSGRRSAKTWPS